MVKKQRTIEEKTEELGKILHEIKEQNKDIYILGHKGLCYDWLGSAMGFKKYAKGLYGIESIICGETEENAGYKQNTELMNKAKISLESPTKIKKDSVVVFVDCQPGEENTYSIEAEPIICINHHELTAEVKKELKKVRFTDLRNTGSNVAIIAEYMQTKGIKLTKSDTDLSTIMLYGLRVDTDQYRKENLELEHRMTPYLSENADLGLIKHLENRPTPNEVKNLMSRAIYATKGEYQIAIVPKVSNADFVAPTADMLTKFEGYKLTVVVAEVREENNHRFVIKGRSTDPGMNVNTFIQTLFKTGGGHSHSAGAEINFSKLYELYNLDMTKEKSIIQQLSDALTTKMGSIIEEKIEPTPP